MSILDKLACAQGRRDDVPNQELARELVKSNNKAGIKELAENLWNKDEDIRSDCIKTLYEVGYLKPALIADYVNDFLRLIKDKNNRLVWGGMLALGSVALLKPDEIFTQVELIKKITRSGSVITVDNTIKTLALVASAKPEYNAAIFPFLIEHLQTCRPKDVPQHSEKTMPAVTSKNKAEFIATLNQRMDSLSASQLVRVKKVIRVAERK